MKNCLFRISRRDRLVSHFIVMSLVIFLYSQSSWAEGCDEKTLSELTDTPYSSPWDAYEKMACVEEKLITSGDRRAIFLTIYRLITYTISTAIDNDEFEDKQWITLYLTNFVNKYRLAFNDYEDGRYDQVPNTWIIAFDTALTGEGLIVQDAGLGMIAHITRDLAYTLSDVAIKPNRESKYRDHNYVNTVLSATFEEVQYLLADIYGAKLDEIFLNEDIAPFMDKAFGVGMKAVRDRAWFHAMLLTELPPFLRFIPHWLIDRSSTNLSYALLFPNKNQRFINELRLLEGSESSSVFCETFSCLADEY